MRILMQGSIDVTVEISEEDYKSLQEECTREGDVVGSWLEREVAADLTDKEIGKDGRYSATVDWADLEIGE